VSDTLKVSDTFLGVSCAAALAALAIATTASAAVFLLVTPSTVHRGALVYIKGNAGDCPHGDAVTILSRAFPRLHSFAGVPAVYATVGAGGRFHATTRIPIGRRVGKYVVTARCGGGNLGVATPLRVV
jgi:hypothetical protein